MAPEESPVKQNNPKRNGCNQHAKSSGPHESPHNSTYPGKGSDRNTVIHTEYKASETLFCSFIHPPMSRTIKVTHKSVTLKILLCVTWFVSTASRVIVAPRIARTAARGLAEPRPAQREHTGSALVSNTRAPSPNVR